MGTLRDLGQKIKGKGQQYQGDQQIRYGHTVRGSVNKVKGKLNEMSADTKMKSRRRRIEEESY